MKTPKQIIEEAIRIYNPVAFVLMFSGGHDSHVTSHVSATILKEMGLDFVVYHGDTTIGIPETQQYVKDVCKLHGWKLRIRKPPKKEDYYDAIVEKHGFPGSTRESHKLMYFRLKERAIRAFVTYECKSSPLVRENVLLMSGVRKSESKVRMGYQTEFQKDRSRIWTTPIFWKSEKWVDDYMKEHNLPRNPVKDRLCISGECLCGSFAGYEELAEINVAYPSVGQRLYRLWQKAIANGFPWPWSQGPTKWYKNHPKGTMDMFMCVGCDEKKNYKED